jgi:hypothetical protein
MLVNDVRGELKWPIQETTTPGILAMTGTRHPKPVKKAERPQVAILPMIHNVPLKQVRKVARLPAVSHAMLTGCPEGGKEPSAEVNSPTTRTTPPSQARKVARVQVGAHRLTPTHRTATGRAVAAATLPMTGIKPHKRGVKVAITAAAEDANLNDV